MSLTIGDRIKNLRLEQEMTLQQVGDYIGVSRATVQRYESGEISSVPSDKIEKLADLFLVSPAVIMGWEGMPKKVKAKNNKQIPIYKDLDFTVLSNTRKLEKSQRNALRQSLIICTSPVEERPSRDEILIWLNENVRIASFDGSNYEDRDDESLYRLYKELKDEMDGN